jgi:mono/diheme cytochrome c family protein
LLQCLLLIRGEKTMKAALLATAASLTMAAGAARADGDAEKGRELAEQLCKGCHVIGVDNRHGGIDSTPSFFLMSDKIDNYRQRLWSLRRRPPHTAYERLDDVSPDDIEHLLAYIGELERP